MIVTEDILLQPFKLKSLIRLKRAFYDNNNKKNYLLPFHDKCLKLNSRQENVMIHFATDILLVTVK